MDTHFAPATRGGDEELLEEMQAIAENPVLDGVMELASGLLAVLNEYRQIVALNDTLLELIGIDNADEAFGLRPGEALRCVHRNEMPGGCGTSEYCSTCGAAVALVAALGQDRAATETCAVTVDRNGSTDDLYFKVSACPVVCDGRRFVLLFLHDITEQQQWAALEWSFFHDINNTVMGLLGFSQLLTMHSDEETHEDRHMVHQLAMRLAKEIAIQNCLVRDNQNSYRPVIQTVSAQQVFNDTRELFREHNAARGKDLVLGKPPVGMSLRTDPTLLERILNNMIVNALEASIAGDKVRVDVSEKNGMIVFSVWNKQVIPEPVTKRVFQRNFSTKKDTGRGLGTYSMKLFGEHYLGGAVDFTTSKEHGTTFTFALPQ